MKSNHSPRPDLKSNQINVIRSAGRIKSLQRNRTECPFCSVIPAARAIPKALARCHSLRWQRVMYCFPEFAAGIAFQRRADCRKIIAKTEIRAHRATSRIRHVKPIGQGDLFRIGLAFSGVPLSAIHPHLAANLAGIRQAYSSIASIATLIGSVIASDCAGRLVLPRIALRFSRVLPIRSYSGRYSGLGPSCQLRIRGRV